MFISHKSFLVGLPDFPGPGRSAWRMLERESTELWYQLIVRVTEGVKRRTKKVLVADASLLSDILAQQSTDYLVERVQVITDPSLNGGDSDRMERLISLSVGYDQSGMCVIKHKVAGGAVYSSAVNEGVLTGVQTIYEDGQSNHGCVTSPSIDT